MHSLGIVQWNSTRRDHPGNPGEVSGSGPVNIVVTSVPVSLTVQSYGCRPASRLQPSVGGPLYQ